MNEPIVSGNTIVIPSSHDFLAVVDAFLERILKSYGTEESIIADIAISVSELVINAINHGNKSARGTEVKVVISRSNNDVSITVTDQGKGFNPDEIADPLAPENLLKEAGRGIFVVKSLMDKVDIQAGSHGTSVTVTKAIK